MRTGQEVYIVEGRMNNIEKGFEYITLSAQIKRVGQKDMDVINLSNEETVTFSLNKDKSEQFWLRCTTNGNKALCFSKDDAEKYIETKIDICLSCSSKTGRSAMQWKALETWRAMGYEI